MFAPIIDSIAIRRGGSSRAGCSRWLGVISSSATIDHLRRKKPVEVDREPSTDGGETTWEVLEADEDGASPERRFEMGETARSITAALADLRDNYREVLVLRFEHELSYQEIADVTGASLSSVKVQLHRARKALARELEKRGVAAPEAFS